VTEAQVRDMLGLADRGQVFDLFEALMAGRIGDALANLERQYTSGVDPQIVLQDLLDLTHWLTRLKITPEAAAAPSVPQFERERGGDLATRLAMPILTRAWQILLKGVGEARMAPEPLQAVEMVLVRLAYAADLPSPAEALKAMREGEPAPAKTPNQPAPARRPEPVAQAIRQPEPLPGPQADIRSFADVIQLADEHRQALLSTHLRNSVHLVRLEPGRLEFRPGANAPRDLAQQLSRHLESWTGARWMVAVSSDQGEATVAEQEHEEEERRRHEAEADPMIAQVLQTFPGAKVVGVHDRDRLDDTSED